MTIVYYDKAFCNICQNASARIITIREDGLVTKKYCNNCTPLSFNKTLNEHEKELDLPKIIRAVG